MGGDENCRGNATAAAEFNFFADPHAARIVFESCNAINDAANKAKRRSFGIKFADTVEIQGCDLTLVSWSATVSGALPWNEFRWVTGARGREELEDWLLQGAEGGSAMQFRYVLQATKTQLSRGLGTGCITGAGGLSGASLDDLFPERRSGPEGRYANENAAARAQFACRHAAALTLARRGDAGDVDNADSLEASLARVLATRWPEGSGYTPHHFFCLAAMSPFGAEGASAMAVAMDHGQCCRRNREFMRQAGKQKRKNGDTVYDFETQAELGCIFLGAVERLHDAYASMQGNVHHFKRHGAAAAAGGGNGDRSREGLTVSFAEDSGREGEGGGALAGGRRGGLGSARSGGGEDDDSDENRGSWLCCDALALFCALHPYDTKSGVLQVSHSKRGRCYIETEGRSRGASIFDWRNENKAEGGSDDDPLGAGRDGPVRVVTKIDGHEFARWVKAVLAFGFDPSEL